MIKLIEKIKNILRKDNLYHELRLDRSLPSKNFESKLKDQFLTAALNEDRHNKARAIFGVQNLYTLLFASTVVVIIFGGFYKYDYQQRNEQELRSIFMLNSQTALIPFLFNTDTGSNLSISSLLSTPNIVPIYGNKQNYIKVTTQQFKYGPAFDKCESYYLFDKNVKKTITYEYYKNPTFKYRAEIYDQNDNLTGLFIYDGEFLYENINGESKKYKIEPVFKNPNELPDINILQSIQNESGKNKSIALINSKIKCGEELEDSVSKVEWDNDSHEINKVDLYAGSEDEDNLIMTTETLTETLLDLDLDGLFDGDIDVEVDLEGVIEVDLDTGGGDIDLDLEVLNIPLPRIGL